MPTEGKPAANPATAASSLRFTKPAEEPIWAADYHLPGVAGPECPGAAAQQSQVHLEARLNGVGRASSAKEPTTKGVSVVLPPRGILPQPPLGGHPSAKRYRLLGRSRVPRLPEGTPLPGIPFSCNFAGEPFFLLQPLSEQTLPFAAQPVGLASGSSGRMDAARLPQSFFIRMLAGFQVAMDDRLQPSGGNSARRCSPGRRRLKACLARFGGSACWSCRTRPDSPGSHCRGRSEEGQQRRNRPRVVSG